MARTNIVLTDELHKQAKAYGINVSEVCRNALSNAVLQARVAEKAKGWEHTAVYDKEVLERFVGLIVSTDEDTEDDPEQEVSEVELQDELDNAMSVFFGSRFYGEYNDPERVYITDKGRIVTVAHYNGDEDYPYIASIEELVEPDPMVKAKYEELLGEPKVLDI